MRKAILRVPGEVSLENTSRQAVLWDTQVRVRTIQGAICGSDIDLWDGRNPAGLPNLLGHEFAGVVTECGKRVPLLFPGLTAGTRVAVWTPDGQGFADEYVAEAENCIPVSDAVAHPALAEPIGCIHNMITLAAPKVGDDVVVVGGTGFMGLLTVIMSRLAGARTIIAAGRRAEGLELALRLGATHAVDTNRGTLEDEVVRIVGGGLADVVYELTGVAEGLWLAGRSTRMSGKLVIGGYHQGDLTPADIGGWNGKGLKTYNGHFRPPAECVEGMRYAVRLMQSGAIDTSPFVRNDDVFALSDIQEAFRYAAGRPEGFVKALVVPDQ